jgi:DNA modification methylase
MEINRIHCGDCRDLLRQMPDEYVQVVVTSPPYWSLRDYGLDPVIWDAHRSCEHSWQLHQRAQRGSINREDNMPNVRGNIARVGIKLRTLSKNYGKWVLSIKCNVTKNVMSII